MFQSSTWFVFLTKVLGTQNTMSHEIFAGVYFCGLVIGCVLRELSFVIRTDWLAKIGTRKNFVPHGKTEHLFTHCLVCLLVGFSLDTKRHCNSYRVLKPKCEHFCSLSKCKTPLSSQSKNIRTSQEVRYNKLGQNVPASRFSIFPLI